MNLKLPKPHNKEKGFSGLLIILLIFVVCVGTIFFYVFIAKAKQTLDKNLEVTQPLSRIKENRENMTEEAKVHFDKAMMLFDDLRANSTDVEALKPIADQTIAELTKATEIEPENPVIWSELANAYTWPNNSGNLEGELDAFRMAEKLEPNNVVYINNVGDALIRLGRYEEAVLQFQKTFRLTDNSGYAHLSAGFAYEQLGIADSAKENYKNAIEIFEGENESGKYDDEILTAQKGISRLP